jgi:hypothetical protein
MVQYGATRGGATRGGRTPDASYVEGILARLIEAADNTPATLPAVSEPGFLCGQEFDSVAEEGEFFASRNLHLDQAEVSIRLRPGQLLIFDNLALAHGRRGRRELREVHQWMFGYRQLDIDLQFALRDELLDAFVGPGG